MSEYLRDKDGDVWRVGVGELVFHRYDGGRLADVGAADRRGRGHVEAKWGPLVPCTEEGSPLVPEPHEAGVRALVAAAFLEFAAEMDRAYWATRESTEEAVYIRARDAAKAVTEGVLSGDIKPAEGAE
ncbi:hypothetical protein ATKI12_6950 [Kitasatospora sp. Ki12]